MAGLTVLTESELRSLVGFGEEELAAIEAVYPLITAGVGSMPPILRVGVPEHRGEIDVKSAYLPGYDGIAVKVSTGFFDNPARGLPSLGGLMMVFDSETGLPRAALFDNGYLTDLRTALAGAVAARHLAREGADRAAVLGAGAQARYQLEALGGVRPVTSVRVWARRGEAAAAYAEDLADRLGVEVAPAASVDEAVADADVVVTATPATEPLLDASHLRPGMHITAVGSDAEHKRELATDLLGVADLVVCDSLVQSRRLGELHHAEDDGARIDAVELGAVISGEHPGRTDPGQISVCDLTGTGAQDTAIAALAVTRAEAAGAGTRIDT